MSDYTYKSLLDYSYELRRFNSLPKKYRPDIKFSRCELKLNDKPNWSLKCWFCDAHIDMDASYYHLDTGWGAFDGCSDFTLCDCRLAVRDES